MSVTINLKIMTHHNERHVAILYKLMEERPAEANISHKQMPTMAEHRHFLVTHPYSAWWIIMDEDTDTPVGSIYLTRKNEIGIFILKEHQRKGYAKQALEMFMRVHECDHFLANVAPGNAVSHAFFKAMGGKVIQHTYSVKRPNY